MAELFSSGRIVDLVLLVTVLEAALLLGWRARTGRGPRPAALLANLAAGGCLLLALRGAIVAAPWPWLAAALLGALVAHLVDVALRWRG